MLEKHQKVFGLGLSRTGTTSLSGALNYLGIKTIHFPSDDVTFQELKNGNYKLSILNDYQGAVDTPIAPFYAQFDKIYPRSKFILTVRSIDTWLQSLHSHWTQPERPQNGLRPFVEFIRSAAYGIVQFSEERLRYVYETHTRNVLEFFSNRKKDLLVMDVCNGDGWEKLCPFLGLSIPNIPFPSLNDSVAKLKWIKELNSAIEQTLEILPEGSRFVLVGVGKLGVDIPGALPSDQRHGLDWGAAENVESVVQEIEQVRQNGIRYLVFFFPHFWWFEYYTGLNNYLEEKFSCITKNNQLMVFEVRRTEK